VTYGQTDRIVVVYNEICWASRCSNAIKGSALTFVMRQPLISSSVERLVVERFALCVPKLFASTRTTLHNIVPWHTTLTYLLTTNNHISSSACIRVCTLCSLFYNSYIWRESMMLVLSFSLFSRQNSFLSQKIS